MVGIGSDLYGVASPATLTLFTAGVRASVRQPCRRVAMAAARSSDSKSSSDDDVHQNGLASVGPFDAVMISAQNMEPWLRVHITPAIISVLPMWVTANLITLADFGVCVLFTVAAAYSNVVPAWQGFALKILVAVLFIVFALMDVLVRGAADRAPALPLFALCVAHASARAVSFLDASGWGRGSQAQPSVPVRWCLGPLH